jgi:hypothetical protein
MAWNARCLTAFSEMPTKGDKRGKVSEKCAGALGSIRFHVRANRADCLPSWKIMRRRKFGPLGGRWMYKGPILMVKTEILDSTTSEGAAPQISTATGTFHGCVPCGVVACQEVAMNCYVCATASRAEPAVAICPNCGAGLCLEHVREAAAWPGPGGMAALGCAHHTLRARPGNRGSKAQSS